MYEPAELASFALAEFERGLENLTEEEAAQRVPKADGTLTNSISWIVAHVGVHWIQASRVPAGVELREDWTRFSSGPTAEPTPPSLSEALAVLHAAREIVRWTESADEGVLGMKHARPEWRGELTARRAENVGTRLLRAVLHTWYHTGEVNMIRQLQGHPPINFVGTMIDHLEWRLEPEGVTAL